MDKCSIAITRLAKAKATELLSYGEDMPSKLEEFVARYLSALPSVSLLTAFDYHEIVKRHAYQSEPPAPGMYLKLLHGRTAIDETMNDWGPDGPWIGPLRWFHCSYLNWISMGFVDGQEFVSSCSADNLPAPIYFLAEMIYFDGMYYGDWELQQL